MSRIYLGKYRGTVINNVDPSGLGRVQVLVPDVSPEAITSWAMPCIPLGLTGPTGSALPNRGATVWIEFEQGDMDHPIWTGVFFGQRDDVPDQLKWDPRGNLPRPPSAE